MEGFVYVLSHPLWPGWVKIGHTKQDPRKRSLQIASASGMLRTPKVEWCCQVADSAAVERAVHLRLSHRRVQRRRELFNVTVDEARQVISGACDTRTITPKPRRGRAGGWQHRSTRRRRIRIIGLVCMVLSAALMWLAAP